MKYSRHAIALLIALLFSWLFFQRAAGINLFVFDAALISAIFFLQKEKLQSQSVRLFLVGLLASSVFVTIHNSGWSIFIHHLSLFLLGGALAAPHLKSVASVAVAAMFNTVISVVEYVKSRAPKLDEKRPWVKALYALRISIIPILLVVLFGTLYSNASPWFNTFWNKFSTFIGTVFGDLVEMISFTWFFMFVLGLFITVYLLFANSISSVSSIEETQPDDLEKPKHGKADPVALKREYQVALLLFGSLNLMLFGQNILDFTHVWIGFEWEGAFLKQFVHEGTWLLIISILLSAALILYYFRSDLHFMENNKVLKILAYIFIFQNMFLAASVAVRNIWYIGYFNLAFKRIGVFFFLVAVVYGLYTIYTKVSRQKTIYYLLKKNSIAVYVLLLVTCFANWDTIIAKYNFAHADKAYVHLSFLSKLDDSALPYLKQPLEKLEQVKQDQDLNYGRDKYAMGPMDYEERINDRITTYQEKYRKRHWLEWNYADWRAYKLLKDE